MKFTQNNFVKFLAYLALVASLLMGCVLFYFIEMSTRYYVFDADSAEHMRENYLHQKEYDIMIQDENDVYYEYARSKDLSKYDGADNPFYYEVRVTEDSGAKIHEQNLLQNEYYTSHTQYFEQYYENPNILPIGMVVDYDPNLIIPEDRSVSPDELYSTIKGINGEVFRIYEDNILEVVDHRSVTQFIEITLYYKQSPIPAEDLATYEQDLAVAERLFEYRTVLVLAPFALGIIAILCTVFLTVSAGKKANYDGIYLNLFDRIPYELHILFISIALGVTGSFFYHYDSIIAIAMATLSILYLPLMYISLCARIKARKFWDTTIIYGIILKPVVRVVGKPFRFMWANLKGNIMSIPFVGKAGLFGTALAFGALVLSLIGFAFGSPILFALGVILLFAGLISICMLIALWINKLHLCAKNISKGDYKSKVDTDKMLIEFREFGNALNNIGSGMDSAIDEKLKSERLKTELITNVSHDIKTPLTSIINYVDLLKKEEIQNEKIEGYIEVIDRQSAKLKNLITDLVDASKISTGNVKVCLEKLDLAVIASQIEGEYREKLETKNLTLITNFPQDKVLINADSRHMHRIFDNLMSNIIKYSLQGTRVYLEVVKDEENAIISIKNTSEHQLNIKSEELLERFVRGDSSRHTDGNGLGLSIAQSLTAVQGAKLDIIIDGDLFKVNLIFDVINHDRVTINLNK